MATGDQLNGLDEANSHANWFTAELKHRAEREIGEKEAWRDRDIQALRDQVAADPGLMAPQSDEFLLRFLRASKFDYEAAHRRIKAYYGIQVAAADLFCDLDRVRPVFEDGTLAVLRDRTTTDDAVIVFIPGRWNAERYQFEDIMAAFVLSMEQLLRDERNQITGAIAIIDMSDVSWSHVRSFGPSHAKRVIHLVEEALPIRITQIHVVNRSQVARIASQVIKPFLIEEITSRSHLYSDVDGLHGAVSADILPIELGGKAGYVDGLAWFESMKANDRILSQYWAISGFGLVPTGDEVADAAAAEQSTTSFLTSKLAAVTNKDQLLENLKTVQLPSSLMSSLSSPLSLFGKSKEG